MVTHSHSLETAPLPLDHLAIRGRGMILRWCCVTVFLAIRL
jgi:hypothetical protein